MAVPAKSRRGSNQPVVGELRWPVSLARSTREPDTDSGATGFIRTLQPYLDTFAKKVEAERRVLDGGDTRHEIFHVFTIRTPDTMLVEERDYLVCDAQLYRVAFTKAVGQQGRFIELLCRIEGRYAEHDAVVDTDTSPDTKPDDDAIPLWMGG